MNKRIYLWMISVLFLICVVIIKFLSSYVIIRGFVGDVVFTMMLYFILRYISNIKPIYGCFSVLLATYIVEVLQYFNFTSHVTFLNNKMGRLIFGATFDIKDMMAYTIGVAIVYILEKIILNVYKNKDMTDNINN